MDYFHNIVSKEQMKAHVILYQGSHNGKANF